MIQRARPIIIGPGGTLSADRIRQRTELGLFAVGALVVLVTLVLGAGLFLSLAKPAPVILAAIVLVLMPLLWRYPRLSLYTLVGGATLFETFKLNFPDSLTDKVPFFKSLNSMGIPIPLAFTPAEILMMLALVILVANRVVAKDKPLRLGPLFSVIGFYTLLVAVGIFHGLGSGGDLTTALWEARSQIYVLLMYLIAFNLIETPAQARSLLWIFLVTVGLKGVVGSVRYVVTLGGDLARMKDFTSYNSILDHTESYFFALFLALLFALFLFRTDRKMLRWGLAFSPAVLIAFLANERRAGMLVLLLAFMVIAAAGYVLVKSRRKLLKGGLVLALAALPVLILALGNGPGPLALPSRAVASIFNPSTRDLSSDAYRVAEAQNVKFNISLNPILGRGYGIDMQLPYPIPDLTSLFVYWRVVPHNTLLWVWMRLGFFGFVAFLFLVGRSMVAGLMTARKASGNPWVQAVAVFGVAAVVAWVSQGVVDMGLTDWRIAILTGAVIGLVARLSLLQDSAALAAEPASNGPTAATQPD